MPQSKLELKSEVQLIDFDMYEYYTPEKLELFDGKLLANDEARERLLLLLIYNVGVKRTLELEMKSNLGEIKSDVKKIKQITEKIETQQK